MKKLFTLCLLVLCCYAINTKAQSPRLILAEEFTNAGCGPCASQNPAFNTLLNNNPTKVVAIKYQTDGPGYDPMNITTSPMVNVRADYYEVEYVPTGLMDGLALPGASYTGAPSNWTQAKITTRAATQSAFTVNVSHSFNASRDSIFITVNINCTQAHNGASMVAHVAIVEREIDFCSAPGTNGETSFEGVMRTMLPNASGTVLPNTWTVGQSQTLTFADTLSRNIYDKNRVAVVAFIQDNQLCHQPSVCTETYSVLQAGYSAPLPPIDNDAHMTCTSNIPRYGPCDASAPVNGSVTITNSGFTNLTSANINYSFDQGTVNVIPWTGNLANGASDNVTIPTFNPAPGQHYLSVSVTDPNNAPDVNTKYDSQIIPFSTYSDVGSPLPLSQTFGNTTFPPDNWRIINPNNGVTWQRVSSYKRVPVGYNSQGCSMLACFSSADGQIDELWTTNYDFSAPGTTTAQIDFDVAYCRYTTENDKLEVMYSTDCGASWHGIYNEAGTVLASGNPDTAGYWVPWSNSQWHHKTADLTGAVGNSNVFVKFKGTSNFGNNMFVDNVNVNTNLTTGIENINVSNEFNVYPNPSNGEFNLEMNITGQKDVTITITNSLGAIVKTYILNKISSGIIPLDLSNEARGSYTMTIKTEENLVNRRITITK
jgi:hypothetical protein